MLDLTKWPRLLVVGDPVTREQANEILIRTDDWSFCLNDAAWEQTVCALGDEYGMPVDSWRQLKPGEYLERWREIEARKQASRERMGILDLYHMSNERIGSAWIGGPKGWCDWDGRIGCSTYNIGKWPSVEEVSEDWETIAAAFPYLDLHAQLVTDEGEGQVAATWAVKDGKAALVEPAGLITEVREFELTPAWALSLASSHYNGRERGVTVERLREALEYVRESRG